MSAPDPVVLGVDLGTTSTKVGAFDARGRLVASANHGYPLDEPSPGHATQDPALIVAAAFRAVCEVVAQVGASRVAGLSFSAAMHSVVGLGADDVPLTPVVTWADVRAAEQADRFRAEPGGLALHRRTGTPLHPMSPLPKLAWFAEQEPELAARVRRWVGIKEVVLHRLCGRFVVDHSIASATGLLDLAALDWDAEALALARVRRDQLSELVPTTTVLPGLTAEAAEATGLDVGTPCVVGASDGVLANLGVGAVRPGVAACSIGTSGALRVVVDRPAVDPRGRVFCYALTPGRWVVGGAINNGGVVLGWVGDTLVPELGEGAEPELMALAERAPVGSGGLLMLPYLLSERAPHWSSLPRAAYVGLTRSHGREHLVRAAVEGVCLQLAVVLDSLEDAGLEVHEVRATGGTLRSDLWRRTLAAALRRPVSVPQQDEGSAFGAALLGLEALGLVESVEVAAELVGPGEVVEPDAHELEVLAGLRPVFADLYDALVPTFTALRDLGLPIER